MAKKRDHFIRPDYNSALSAWQLCRDCYDGFRAVKARAAVYLPLLPGQDGVGDAGYQAYISRATFYNVMDRTVDALSGLVLQKDAIVEATASIKKQIDELSKRITQTAQSLSSVLMRTIQEDLIAGRVGLLLDMPRTPEGAPLPTTQPRPFWLLFRAEQIIGWRTGTNDDGMEVPIWVVVEEQIEEVDKDGKVVFRDRWRELFIGDNDEYQVQFWRRVDDEKTSEELRADGDVITPLRRGAPLSFIPFLCVGPNGVGFDIQKPPLEDMADVNISLYRTSADLELARHVVCLPTHITTGWAGHATGGPPAVLPVGPGKAWHLPAGGTAEILEFTGQGLTELREAVKEKKEEMAALGARLLQKNSLTPEAAETVRMRQGAEVSALHVVVSAVSQAFTIMLRWSMFWMALTEDPDDESISYSAPTDFIDEQIDAQQLNGLLLALQAGKISYATWYHNLARGGITRPGVSVEDEIETIKDEGGDDPGKPPEPDPESKPPDDDDDEDE